MTEDRRLLQFDRDMLGVLAAGIRVALRRPAMALSFYRLYRQQMRAKRRRRTWAAQGMHVPPLVIATVTGRCNLRCKGCYAWAQGRPATREMSPDLLLRTVAQAHDLGLSTFLIAGGEPFCRPELLNITGTYPDIWFPIFTNGTLIDEQMIARLQRQPHVWPLISLEGNREATDARRGNGIYDRVLGTMQSLDEAGVFFGTSITLTRQNYYAVTDDAFIAELIAVGCRSFVYVNYIPVEEGTDDRVPSPEQLAGEKALMARLRRRHPAVFVRFPGDEEGNGGCLAAGKGLFHISPEGNLEPCPFAPYSDVSLHDMSLAQGLRQSRLFAAVRQQVPDLPGEAGRCLMHLNREWLADTHARVTAPRESQPV